MNSSQQSLWNSFFRFHGQHKSNGLRELEWIIQKILPRRHTSFIDRLYNTNEDGIWNGHDHHFNFRKEIQYLRKASFSKESLLEYIQLSLHEDEQRRLYRCMHDRINRHKPLQYILASEPFCSLNVKVRPPVLIPRTETSEWCSSLIEIIRREVKDPHYYDVYDKERHGSSASCASNSDANRPLRILDLCSGSGCISLALAKHLPFAQVLGIDSSKHAVRLSRLNHRIISSSLKKSTDVASTHDIQKKSRHSFANVSFLHGDITKHEEIKNLIHSSFFFHELSHGEGFDVIVSNPPYISQGEKPSLDKSVVEWEDPEALFSRDVHELDPHGVYFYRHLAKLLPLLSSRMGDLNSKLFLKSNSNIPLLVMEIGESQGDKIASIFRQLFPALRIDVRLDLFGRPRSIWIFQ